MRICRPDSDDAEKQNVRELREYSGKPPLNE